MNREPLVSIILPVYNAEKFIESAVNSVLDQTYSNWELIIINDGCTDGTVAYLKNIQHPSIQIIHQDNKGVSAARNTGLSKAKGEYITFLDADDKFPVNSLATRVEFLEDNPEVQIVGGQVDIYSKDFENIIVSKKPNYKGRFLPRLLKLDDQIFSSICYLFRKNTLFDLKFNENMTHCEDLLFWIELSTRSDLEYASIEPCIYNYRVVDTSATHDDIGWRNGYFDLINQISKNTGIHYRDTIYMRMKIIYILISWHIKNLKLKGFFNIFTLLYR